MNGSAQEAEGQTKPRISAVRILLAGLLLVIGVSFLAFAMSSSNAANKDFVTYWAAGKQLIHHANPYDPTGIFRLEREAGMKEDHPYFMRNPPIALFLAVPFGFMSEWLAAILWSLLLVAALMASIRMIWLMQGRPEGRLHLLGYLFPPALECLTVGQVGIFLLLGFTGFLYFHKTRPFTAGAFLVLCLLKPHIFIPLSFVMLLWCLDRKAYRLMAGFGATLAGCALFTQIIDPSAWSQYAQMMRTVDPLSEPLPTISLLFRAAIDIHAAWLQFVPAMAATVWAIWYFQIANRPNWSWNRQGMLLLTVSVMVAPYAFVTDEAVVLPAILAVLYALEREDRSLVPFACVVLPALLEVLMGKGVNTFWYVWTAPAWFGFYLYATRMSKGKRWWPGQESNLRPSR